jgi:hypothetical protein
MIVPEIPEKRRARGIPFTPTEWIRIAAAAKEAGIPATVWVRATLSTALKAAAPTVETAELAPAPHESP